MEHVEKLYKPKEVAATLGVSVRTVIRMFRDEPGVLKLFGLKNVPRGKVQRVTLRIPKSAIDRAKEGKVTRLSHELTLFRRHRRNCRHRKKGRSWKRCVCPIWCDGTIDGKRVRMSLKTTSWLFAEQRPERKFVPDHPLDEQICAAFKELLESRLSGFRETSRDARLDAKTRHVAHLDEQISELFIKLLQSRLKRRAGRITPKK